MDMSQESFDRVVFFEQARQIAEAHYAMNPLDAENLTKWGGALLELSQFQNGPDCMKMLTEAVSKLEEALVVSPRKHDTLWCLGNARTSQAFLTTNEEEARSHFTKATECFQKALQEDPGNELYLKSLELVAKSDTKPTFHPTRFITAFSTWSLEPSPLFAKTLFSFTGHLVKLERVFGVMGGGGVAEDLNGPLVSVDHLRAYLQILDVSLILDLDQDTADHAFQLFRDCLSTTCLMNQSVEALATATLVQAICEA